MTGEQHILMTRGSPGLAADLAAALWASDLDVHACFQCGRCSSGCPVCDHMDLGPMEVVRLCSYGQEDMVLQSQALWLCASCQTCTTRCPNGIDIAAVMDLARQMVLTQGRRPARRRIAAFHRSFLRSVRRWGRTFELGMLAAYKMRTGALFADLGIGMSMMGRGRLHVFPRGIRGRREVRRLFMPAARPDADAKGEVNPERASSQGVRPKKVSLEKKGQEKKGQEKKGQGKKGQGKEAGDP